MILVRPFINLYELFDQGLFLRVKLSIFQDQGPLLNSRQGGRFFLLGTFFGQRNLLIAIFKITVLFFNDRHQLLITIFTFSQTLPLTKIKITFYFRSRFFDDLTFYHFQPTLKFSRDHFLNFLQPLPIFDELTFYQSRLGTFLPEIKITPYQAQNQTHFQKI